MMDDHQLDEFYQPTKRVNKKVKICDNPQDDDGEANHEEIDNKNPFHVQVILDVLFKMLSFEDVKKFRLVSSTWNQVGTVELSKRPQKSIKFFRIEDLDAVDDKLGALVQLRKRHNEVFSGDDHQIFSNFSFDISLLTSPQIYQIFENFSPKYIELFGVVHDQDVREILCKILIKISPTVQEINYHFNAFFNDTKKVEDYIQELTSTSFPNLRKISYDVCSSGFKLFFYSLIGQNSPKLHHLKLGSMVEQSLGSSEIMKEQFEQAGLMLKLQILSLLESHLRHDQAYLKIFTEFGQNGVLKLRKLQIQQGDRDLFKFAHLIETQAKTLKILEISNSPLVSGSTRSNNILPQGTRVSFPSLQNLSILQINNFSSFKHYFEPINFALQFPKLVEFKTSDYEKFLGHKVGQLGHDGGSVKSITLFKDKYETKESNNFHTKRLDLNQLYQIFPNLKFLKLDLFNLEPISVPFSSQLRKVVIHCELKDLYNLRQEILKDVKRVELMVDCGNKLIDEDSYKDYLGGLMMYSYLILDHFSRKKYYQQFLDRISQVFMSLHSVYFTFIGRKISEDFKLDFEAILPHSDFICTPFKSAKANEN